MGVSPLMSLGVKAMAANYAALQTTGHNIANANVRGYSRQQVELATSQGQYTGAGFFGRGVDVATVTRAHNEYLTRESASATALASMDGARLRQLQQLEKVFTPGDTGLGASANALFQALSDLSSRPNDMATRQVVLGRASDLAARFFEAGSALDQVQFGVNADLKTSVADINALARSIAGVNQRISALRGQGQPPNDALDERDRLIAQLSEQVQVSRIDADDGSTSLFIGGGQRLVLGSSATELRVTADPRDPLRSAVSVVEATGLRTLDHNVLGGGRVAGLLRFQNQDLADGRNLIGRLALAVGGAVNDQQMRGLNLQPPLGQVASSPLFAMGQPQALPNAGNAKDAGGSPIGSVALTVTDAGALQASDYDLRESTVTPGSWQLTRLSDGKVSTVNSGDVVDGMRIDIGSAQGGDRFLLQPTSRVANAMRSLLSDPLDLAAASPMLATTAAANRGTAAIAGMTITSTPLPLAGATARITFTDDSGGYSYELLDSGNNVLGSGSGTWQAGQTLPGSSSNGGGNVDINGFQLMLTGVPRNGDSISVAPTPASAVLNNNGNALSLTNLRDALLVGGFTFTDSWSQSLADVGVRVQSAQSGSDISFAVAGQASQALSGQSGVNLDEEAAKLIQYQQSYQAAAKVLQVAQSLFDTLLQTANG